MTRLPRVPRRVGSNGVGVRHAYTEEGKATTSTLTQLESFDNNTNLPYLLRIHHGELDGVVDIVITVRRLSRDRPLRRLARGRALGLLLVVLRMAMVSVVVVLLVEFRLLVVLWLHRALQLILGVCSAAGRAVRQSTSGSLLLLLLEIVVGVVRVVLAAELVAMNVSASDAHSPGRSRAVSPPTRACVIVFIVIRTT